MAETNQLTLQVEGMPCAGCVASIEKEVAKLGGVTDCQVNLAMKSAVVTYDPSGLDQRRIIDQINGLGFRAKMGGADPLEANARELATAKRDFRIALFLSVPLMALAMWPMIAGNHSIAPKFEGVLQALLAGVVLFYGGRAILADAFTQLRHLRANMNSLIAMGTLTAYGWSLWVLFEVFRGGTMPEFYFESAGMIVTIILLGRYLEAKTKGRAGLALEALLRLRPSEASVMIDGAERRLPVAEVCPGMIILIRPGERIPADGIIIENSPVIDEAMLTGESTPVEKRVGDTALGGSVNGNVAFQMRVTATGDESYLHQIIRLVAQAQGRKAPVQRLADRVASIFAPIVIVIAMLTMAGWWWLAPASPLLIKAVVSVLIIACPCALGLATPTAILTGTGWAARHGIIIKGGDVVENLSTLDTIIFDKTGTLTHGELAVADAVAFEGWDKGRMLQLAAAAESQSEHPVARAISRYVLSMNIEPISVRQVEARPGFGLTAYVDANRVTVGNRSLMLQDKIRLDAAEEAGEAETVRGRTIVYVAWNELVVGIVSLSDALRDEAAAVVTELKDMGLKVTMLSGDNKATARGIADAAGISEFEAELRPEQKQAIVESFRRAGRRVAMVGDGINDAPALAEASVGIAIGSGTDVAMETADVVLVSSDLRQVPRAIRLSHITMRLIRQNLFWAFVYNLAAIPIAAGLFYPVFGLLLSPMVAAAAMAFSSVFVVTNSLRLNRLKLG